MSRLPKFAGFAAFYVKEIMRANLKIAAEVLRPGTPVRRRGFVRISVEGLSDLQLLLLTNLITMTPGSIAFDVTPDGRTAVLHLLLPSETPESDRRRFEADYVRRVEALFG